MSTSEISDPRSPTLRRDLQGDYEDGTRAPSMAVDAGVSVFDISYPATGVAEAARSIQVDEQETPNNTSSTKHSAPPFKLTDKPNKIPDEKWDSGGANITESWEEDQSWDSTGAEIGDDDSIPEIDLDDVETASITSHVSHASSTTLKGFTEPVLPPKGWPFPEYDPSKSFPWFRLPKGLRHQVLGNFFVKSRNVRPYFNAGSIHLAQHDCDYENFDVAALYTGKEHWNWQWYEDATDVLYGGNVFSFTEPRLARWWCERIGRNLKKVKKVVVILSGGDVKGTDTPKTPTPCVDIRCCFYESVVGDNRRLTD